MAQQLYAGVDAAFPGAVLPAGTQILAGYVGDPGAGRPDTPHIWTPGEWNGYVEAHPGLRLLPVYVHNFPDADPQADADNAVDAVLALGWEAGLAGPARRIIAFDLEVLIAYDWVAAVIERIEHRGFTAMPYGSRFDVIQNPSCFGYWTAQLTARPPTVLPQGARGMQWAFGGGWDRNVFDQAVYDGCGVGPRSG